MVGGSRLKWSDKPRIQTLVDLMAGLLKDYMDQPVEAPKQEVAVQES